MSSSICSKQLYSNPAQTFGFFNPKYGGVDQPSSLVDVKNEEERVLNLGITERTLFLVFLVGITHNDFSCDLSFKGYQN